MNMTICISLFVLGVIYQSVFLLAWAGVTAIVGIVVLVLRAGRKS